MPKPVVSTQSAPVCLRAQMRACVYVCLCVCVRMHLRECVSKTDFKIGHAVATAPEDAGNVLSAADLAFPHEHPLDSPDAGPLLQK